MPRKGHTEEQIIRALREAESGKKVADICRDFGVSQQDILGADLPNPKGAWS